jgi:hypothetical protein
MTTQEERQEARRVLDSARGRIVSARFVKKDGSERRMVCRSGVTRHRRGGSLGFDPAAKDLYPCFDMQSREYRFISLATLQELKVNGHTYHFGPLAEQRRQQVFVAATEALRTSSLYAEYDAVAGF